MAVLLVAISVTAVLMTAAMPAWHQMTQREKEAELVFRGQQYVRAIGLFQKKAGPGVLPPSLDVLVQGRFLRKKYKDPITNQDFDLLSPQTQAAAAQASQAQAGRGQQPATGGFQSTGSAIGTQLGGSAPRAAAPGGGGAGGGIIGVASKSKDPSIRLFNGRTHYNEWQFIFVQQQQPQAPGAGGRGAPPVGAGQQGGRGLPPVGGFGGVVGQPSGRGTQGQGRGLPPSTPQSGRGTTAAPSSIFAPRR